MLKKCKKCNGVYILSSRFRWTDVPASLFFMRPVRCAYCGKRQYSSLMPIAGAIYRLTIILVVLAVAGGLYYTKVMQRPLPPLQALKIDVSKVWPSENVSR